MSAHEDLLDYVVAEVQALVLEGIDPDDVKKRALPSARETLDTVPCVLVCPPANQGETVAPHDFEGNRDVSYPVQIVLVSAANADYTVPAAVLDNREAIRVLFQNVVAVPALSVWDTEVKPEPPLDRRRLSTLYHYSPLTVLFHRHED